MRLSPLDNAHFALFRGSYIVRLHAWRRDNNNSDPDFAEQQRLIKQSFDDVSLHFESQVDHCGFDFQAEETFEPSSEQKGTYSEIVPYKPGFPVQLGARFTDEDRRTHGKHTTKLHCNFSRFRD